MSLSLFLRRTFLFAVIGIASTNCSSNGDAGAPAGVNISPSVCGAGTTMVNGVCVGIYAGVWIGPFSGAGVSQTVNINVVGNTITSTHFNGEATAMTPAAPVITDSNISGISNLVTWSMSQVNPGQNSCHWQMTGTFRTGVATASGKSASGSWSYTAGPGCTGGGTWSAN